MIFLRIEEDAMQENKTELALNATISRIGVFLFSCSAINSVAQAREPGMQIAKKSWTTHFVCNPGSIFLWM